MSYYGTAHINVDPSRTPTPQLIEPPVSRVAHRSGSCRQEAASYILLKKYDSLLYGKKSETSWLPTQSGCKRIGPASPHTAEIATEISHLSRLHLPKQNKSILK